MILLFYKETNVLFCVAVMSNLVTFLEYKLLATQKY